jgi:hypothetical protein
VVINFDFRYVAKRHCGQCGENVAKCGGFQSLLSEDKPDFQSVSSLGDVEKDKEVLDISVLKRPVRVI